MGKHSVRLRNNKFITKKTIEHEAIRMKSSERKSFFNRLKTAKVNLQAALSRVRAERKKAQIKRELKQLQQLTPNDDKFSQYDVFDEGSRDLKFDGKKLPTDTQEIIRSAQLSENEFAGGINTGIKDKGVEAITLRRGGKTSSWPDPKKDIQIHTHPDRTDVYSLTKENDSIFPDVRNKIDSLRISNSKKNRLKKEIWSCYDYLPSKEDFEYASNSVLKEKQTLLTVSKDHVISISKRGSSVKPSKDYINDLVKLASLRAFDHQPRSEREAKQMVKKFKRELQRGLQSYGDRHGFDVTMTDKADPILYTLPSDAEREENYAGEDYYTKQIPDLYQSSKNTPFKIKWGKKK